jgi:uncharacterized protein (TIGR02145 family)
MRRNDYIQAVKGAIINQPKYWAKHHNDRVTADGGTITDQTPIGGRSYLTDDYKFLRENRLIDNLVFSWNSASGAKVRTVGVNNYASKIYSLESNDGVQATTTSQPFICGDIAPNEKRKIKNLTDNKVIPHPDITISSIGSNSFTFTTVLRPTHENVGTSSNKGRYLSGLYVALNNTSLAIYTAALGLLSWYLDNTTKFGGTLIVTISANSTGILCYVNGQPFALSSGIYTPFSAILSGIFYTGSDDTLAGEAYSHQIFDRSMTGDEIQLHQNYLRSRYPLFEGMTIGTQHWATSNYEGVVTGNGTIIPEVQNAATVNVLEGGDFEGGLIGIVGFGTGSGSWTLNTVAPISGTQDGLLQVTSVDTNAFRPALTFTGTRKVNTRYKLSFTYKVNSGVVNFKGYHTGGAAVLLNVPLTGSGTYTVEYTCNGATLFELYFDGRTLFNLQLDNIKNEELGWADLTTPAWCYYNNDPLLGAIYGKLYNWPAVQAIAANPPAGWRVPSQADFTQLATYLEGSAVAGGKLKKEGLNYFDTPNTDADNSSGFSAIGAGVRREVQGFVSLKNYISFASSDKVGNGYGYILVKDSAAFQRNDFIFVVTEKTGQSIRLIK